MAAVLCSQTWWSDRMAPGSTESLPALASDRTCASCDAVGSLCLCVSAWLWVEQSPVMRMEAQRISSLQPLLGMGTSKSRWADAFISAFFKDLLQKWFYSLAYWDFSSLLRNISPAWNEASVLYLFKQEMWGLDSHHPLNNNAFGIGRASLAHCSYLPTTFYSFNFWTQSTVK